MPNLKFNDEIRQYAVSLYLTGLSAIEVGKIVGANEATIRNWVKMSGNKTQIGGPISNYSDEFIKQIASMYIDGMYTTEIDKELNLKRGISAYLLKRSGYDLRHRGPKSKIGNEDFFDTIDSKEKAYFLGWLMADGNISITDGQYSIKLHISISDKELIDKFLLAINSDNKTKIKRVKYTSYYVSLTSVHMCKALIDLGVTPSKSGKEIYPRDMPSNLHNHFVRGVFDGDGITDIKRGRSGFVGSKDIVESIMNIIGIKLTIFQNKKNDKIYYYLDGKKYSRILYEYLYSDATVWLERKRQRLEVICSK